MFEDLKILELASVLAGPSVGQFFAELGASVIKVENARAMGDVTRSWKVPGETTDDRSSYFCSVNWGKKSVAVNMDSADGKRIVHRLAAQSDVVIASYKPGDAARMGVDYETLSKLRPALIYGQITGFGSGSLRVGYDAVIQAEAGFMSMNGIPGSSSLKMPVALVDVLAGHHLKEGILLALLDQARTGKGHFVEVSLFQAAVSSLVNQAANWLVGGKIPQKHGSAHPNIAPYGDVCRTASGDEVLLAIGNDRQFVDLCRLLGIPALAQDEQFRTNVGRVAHRARLSDALQERIGTFATDHFLYMMETGKIPCGRVQNVQQVFETDMAKDLLILGTDRTGVKSYVGSPSVPMPSHFLPPPHLGEHTIEVLTKSLNLGAEEVETLLKNGSIR